MSTNKKPQIKGQCKFHSIEKSSKELDNLGEQFINKSKMKG